VICLRRHPADSVQGIYRQLFAAGTGRYRFAYDLESLAEYVAGFGDFAATCAEILSASRFTEIDYERLIGNPEPEIRRLLEFQNNPAPVATASVAQVRQPVLATASGR